MRHRLGLAGGLLVTVLGGYWIVTSSALAPDDGRVGRIDRLSPEGGASAPAAAVQNPTVVLPRTEALMPGGDSIAIPGSSSPAAPATSRVDRIEPSRGTVPVAAVAPGSHELLVPVAGVEREDLVDTYQQARSAGRSHDAIDIIAAAGTPVLAAAGGTVMKLFLSEQGGITLYQLAGDQRTIYYYAHLERYAAGIREGMELRQGQTIGYVGDTGNSGTGNYHLHFEVTTTPDPRKYWGGTPTNPYPLLLRRAPV